MNSAKSTPGRRLSVLVTGASGFIGGALFQRLREMGLDVHGLARRELELPGYRVHDLVRPIPVDQFAPVDVVVHAAARSSPWGSRRQFEAQNVTATRHVLDYCRLTGFPKLIFISSSSVYYRACDQIAMTEDTPMPEQSVNRYAATKRLGEQLISHYEGAWVIVRPRAVFGPGDTVLLPRVLRAARAGKLPLLTRYGEDVIGDLIYVDNLVDYIVTAIQRAEIAGCSYNLTNNDPVSIFTFLLDILTQLEIPAPSKRVSVKSVMRFAALVEVFYSLFRPGLEPPITRFGVHVFAYSKTFDVSRSIADMGPPRVSMEEGVRRTVEWIRQVEV